MFECVILMVSSQTPAWQLASNLHKKTLDLDSVVIFECKSAFTLRSTEKCSPMAVLKGSHPSFSSCLQMETTPRTARARRPRLRGSRNRGTANLLRAPAGGRGVVGWIPALAAVVKKPFLQSGQVAGG